MNAPFEPRNDLEKLLLAAQEGQVEIEEFVENLLGSQLFLPLHDDTRIGNFQRSQTARPLTLETDDGTQVLVLFTSPDRARSFVKDHPGYEGGILTDLNWVFENLGMGFGITLNPGWDAGIDLEPDMVADLARRRPLSS